MASLNLLPNRIHVCCSPEELRKLAAKMEETILKTKLGESTLTEVWVGNEVEVHWHFDQEAKAQEDFIYIPIGEIQEGDVVARTTHMEPHTATAVTCSGSPWWDERDKCWVLPIKERQAANGTSHEIRFSDYVIREGNIFKVRRKR